jgi:hypothetical protein
VPPIPAVAQEKTMTEPDWKVLRVQLKRAIKVAHEVDPCTDENILLLAFDLLFKKYQSDEARLRDTAHRIKWTTFCTEGLEELLKLSLDELRPAA